MSTRLNPGTRNNVNRFICIEGVDGVGKSSALRLAALSRRREFAALKSPPERMNNMRPFYDEGASPEARFFFYLSCVAEISKEIRAARVLSDVCCDRYLLSTIAYHNVMCKTKSLDGYIEIAAKLGLEIPDRNIILLADSKTRLKRLEKRFFESGCRTSTDNDVLLTEKVQREYLRLAEAGVCEVTLVDTSNLSLPEVSERILMEFEK